MGPKAPKGLTGYNGALSNGPCGPFRVLRALGEQSIEFVACPVYPVEERLQPESFNMELFKYLVEAVRGLEYLVWIRWKPGHPIPLKRALRALKYSWVCYHSLFSPA